MRWKEYEMKERKARRATQIPSPPQSCRWFVLSFPMPFVPARAPAIRKMINWIQTGDKWNKMYKNQQTRTSKSFKTSKCTKIWSCFWCSIPPPATTSQATTSSRHTCQATGPAIPKWLDTQDNSSSNWRHTKPKAGKSMKIIQFSLQWKIYRHVQDQCPPVLVKILGHLVLPSPILQCQPALAMTELPMSTATSTSTIQAPGLPRCELVNDISNSWSSFDFTPGEACKQWEQRSPTCRNLSFGFQRPLLGVKPVKNGPRFEALSSWTKVRSTWNLVNAIQKFFKFRI